MIRAGQCHGMRLLYSAVHRLNWELLLVTYNCRGRIQENSFRSVFSWAWISRPMIGCISGGRQEMYRFMHFEIVRRDIRGGRGRREKKVIDDGDDGEQFLTDSPTWTNGSEFTITSIASGEASSCGFMQFK